MKKGVDEMIDEGALWWFGHVKKIDKERIAKRVYVGECVGSHSVGRGRNRWIDTVKNCLRKKRGLDVRQARRNAQDRNEWWRFVRGSAWGIAQGDELQTLMRCHSYMKLVGGNLPVAEPTT